MSQVLSAAAIAASAMTVPPGVSRELWQQALSIADKGLGAWDRDRFQCYRHTLYHRVAYSTGATRQTFFDVAPSDQVCNLAAPGLIGNDRAFILVAPRVDIIRGMLNDGTAGTSTASFASAAATAETMAASYEQILRAGALTLRIGTRTIVDRIPDLLRFPSGRGITGYASNTAAGASTANVTNNGEAQPGCAWPGVVYPVPGGKPISAEMTWRSAIASVTACTLELALDGYMILPSND